MTQTSPPEPLLRDRFFALVTHYFQTAAHFFPEVVGRIWKPVLWLELIFQVLGGIFTYFADRPEFPFRIYALAMASILTDFLLPLFLVLIIPWALIQVREPRLIVGSRANPALYVARHFSQVMIEGLRSMGRITIGFLLIIPGIVRCFQFYFVPYITQFSPRYHRGEADALEYSKSLWKAAGPLKVTGLIIVFFLVNLVGGVLLNTVGIFENPPVFFLLLIVSLLIEIFCAIGISCLFLDILTKTEI